MKILIISPFFPYPLDSGGAIRIYNLIRHLSGLHDITLLSYIQQDQLPLQNELSPYCRIVTLPIPEKTRSWMYHARYLLSRLPYSLVYIDNRFKEKWMDMARNSWDIVQFEFLPLAHYVDMAPESAKKVVVEHYIAMESRKKLMRLWKRGLKKFYYLWELWKIAAYEKKILNRFDVCLVTSPVHAQRLRAWEISSRIEVSPNGVDTTYFTPMNGNRRMDKPYTLVYMGAFHLEPANIDGLTYLLEDILPFIQKEIPNIRIEIMGKGLPATFQQWYENHTITFHGYIEDIRPILSKAHAFLIPLRGGSGTKIRILTAMAMGIPVVATSVAAEGIDAEHNRHILIGNTPQAFAEQTIKVLKNPELNRMIGNSGRQLTEHRYTWRKVAEDLNQIYLGL